MVQGSFFRVNQEGYAAGLPACVVSLSTEQITLKDAAGNVLRTFRAETPEMDLASGDRVRTMDLGVLEAGTYTLESAGERRSFTVKKKAWTNVTNALIKGFYFQRCGCALEEKYAGVYTHAACHTAPAADWGDRTVLRKITGGWHDAGDYGKYVGPGAVTAAHLMYAWKLFPDGCSDPLNIPETGNGLPDILNETKYELDWILRMQRSDGAFHHKLTKEKFAPFIMPEDDKEPEYLMPASHCATAAACACLALASRIYRPYNEAYANRMLLAAVHAWAWLQAHPEYVPYKNPEGVFTGWYGDKSDRDERFWAACELYAATRNEEYKKAAEALYKEGQNLTAFGWADVGGLGTLCCLFDLQEKAGDILFTKLKADFLTQSEEALNLSNESGYGTALAPDRYVWGSILPILSNAMAMILNSLLTGRQDMRDAALKQWNYALGMNALDLCFVTGFGEHSVQNPHHRPSGSDGIDAPVPGLISGGPNHNFPFRPNKERFEDLPPAKCYLDELPSADTNEIAIYWNSPAVFVGAFFSGLSRC